jgi:Recombinase zinc beta ribbon domain
VITVEIVAVAVPAADDKLWDRLGLKRSHDPYLLRGILWCGRCGYRLHPVSLAGGGRRSYGCPNRCHGLVDAATTEQLVDDAAARHLPFEVPDAYRAAFYAELLVRVVVDAADRLVFAWRIDCSAGNITALPVLDAAAR